MAQVDQDKERKRIKDSFLYSVGFGSISALGYAIGEGARDAIREVISYGARDPPLLKAAEGFGNIVFIVSLIPTCYFVADALYRGVYLWKKR